MSVNFQSRWFVVGLLTRTLIVHVIRTERIPFVQGRAAVSVLITTAVVMGLGIVLPFTSSGHAVGLVLLRGRTSRAGRPAAQLLRPGAGDEGLVRAPLPSVAVTTRRVARGDA
jgi:magnesium-transporting ATPase (P-type)